MARIMGRQDHIEAAWLGAAVARAKRMPKLRDLLPKVGSWRKRRRAGPMPAEEVRAMVSMWNAVMGGDKR